MEGGMSEGAINAVKDLTKKHAFDFKKVSVDLNDMIASGNHPQCGSIGQCYTPDDCRITYSAFFKAERANKRASQPPTTKTKTPPKNFKKVIDSIETFADAVKFEQDLIRENKEKREKIFQRVVTTFKDLGIEGCGDDASKVELPADVMHAMTEHEKRRELEKERIERMEKEKAERKEIEEARARLRSRFDEGSEDAEGVDPLAHFNEDPKILEVPMTQEELLYEAAPILPIDKILFSDEFEDALASVERELEQAAASKSDDGEISELGEVLAFLDEEAQRNPASLNSKPTIPSMAISSQENLQFSSHTAPVSMKNSENPLTDDAQPPPSRSDGSEKARKIILQKLHEAGNGDLTLVARKKQDGKQELVGRQGQSFTQSTPEASSSQGSHTQPESTPSSSSFQIKQNPGVQGEDAIVDTSLDGNESKMVGRMHYGAVKSNKPNGNGGTRLNISDDDEEEDEDDEEDDDRYMRQRREQKTAAHAAMLKQQQELKKAASLKPMVAVRISEDITEDEDKKEDDDDDNDSTQVDKSPLGAIVPPPPPSRIEEEEKVMENNNDEFDDVDSDVSNGADDSYENDNAEPSISGIGRSRRDKGSSAINRKERMKKSFRKLENKRKDKEGE